MNRRPIYSTNSNLYNIIDETELKPGVIRPPIRNAYDTQYEYEIAVQNGINYALENGIEYVDNQLNQKSLTDYQNYETELKPGVIRPPIRNAYDSQYEYELAVQNGFNYALKNGVEYLNYY